MLARPEKYLMSDLLDWMAEHTNRDAKDYGYWRTDLRQVESGFRTSTAYDFAPCPLRWSPYVWWKTLLVQTMPLGNRYFGTHTLERLERVSMHVCSTISY